MLALEYKMDLSRLKVIELDNINKINEIVNIFYKKIEEIFIFSL